jgi:hypothetical protein
MDFAQYEGQAMGATAHSLRRLGCKIDFSAVAPDYAQFSQGLVVYHTPVGDITSVKRAFLPEALHQEHKPYQLLNFDDF